MFLLKIRWIFIFTGLALLGGCVLSDPVSTGDSPSSPGNKWLDRPLGEMQGEPIPKATANPFTEEDLSKTMALSQLINIALSNNPATRLSWNAARAAAFGYYASLSAYYPAIAISGDIDAEHITGGTGISANFISFAGGGGSNTLLGGKDPAKAAKLKPVTTQSATAAFAHAKTNNATLFNELFASYLLFDFGGRDATAFMAYETLVAANWQHNFTMQEVIMSVLDNYTSYLGNKGLVEADEQNLKDALVALKASEVMRTAGLATFTDVLQAQSAVELARFNLEQAKGAMKISFGDLLITLGLSPSTNITVEDLPQQLPVIEISGDVARLLEVAIRRRPDLQAALAAVRQQEAQLVISYSSGLPTLTAEGSLTQSKFMHFSSNVTPSSSVNRNLVRTNDISLNWNFPVFQGFFYYNQQRQIKAQIQEAWANLDVQVANVETEVVTNYYALTTAIANLPNSLALLESSQRAYKGIVSQYKVGVSSFLDLLNALTTLSNARAQYVLTRTQWAAALANLAFSVGILGETDEEWEESPPKDLYRLKYE